MTGEQAVVTCWGVLGDALAAALATQRDEDAEQADLVPTDEATGEQEALGGVRRALVSPWAFSAAGKRAAKVLQVPGAPGRSTTA